MLSCSVVLVTVGCVGLLPCYMIGNFYLSIYFFFIDFVILPPFWEELYLIARKR